MNRTNNELRSYRSIDELEEVVRRFEACAFGAGEFHHRQHLTVVLWYLWKFPMTEAHARMREGLYKFLAHHGHGRQKYHETITIFWLKKVRALVDGAEEGLSSVEMANEVMEACGDAQLVFAYYSRELIDSDAAREGWTEPDLKALDF